MRYRAIGMGVFWGGLALGCASTPPAVPPPAAAALEVPAAPLWAPGEHGAALSVEPTPPIVSESLRTARLVLRERARKIDPLAQEAVARLIHDAAREHGLPVLTVLGLIEQESRFDPRARGPRGSLGLMQIRPFVARDIAARHGLEWKGDTMLLDPVVNVRLGIIYLAEQRVRFGTTELALAAYNVGPTRLRRLLAAGRTGKGRYVRRVLQKADALAAEFVGPETSAAGG